MFGKGFIISMLKNLNLKKSQNNQKQNKTKNHELRKHIEKGKEETLLQASLAGKPS